MKRTRAALHAASRLASPIAHPLLIGSVHRQFAEIYQAEKIFADGCPSSLKTFIGTSL
ncbi:MULTISPECIES: hypothetical protein [unclassified Caballeronia]|uniref:hypothetical protein n=1 Tax=unclassified Caballeronia TaxID=2646786 RepID=UPI000A7E9F4A|nr:MULTISPECIES: hypothetical protein [unclassified Caballeronia]